MYRIDYERNGVVYPVLRPVDNVYKIFSGTYHRETNGAGKLTFAVRFHHPSVRHFRRYEGIVSLYNDWLLLFRARIVDIQTDHFNSCYVECEGVLAFLNDTIVPPYVFNENSSIHPIPGTGTNCRYPLFVEEIIGMHNALSTPSHQFTFINETGSAYSDLKFSTSSQSYDTAWTNILTKGLNNIGGYLEVRYTDTENQLVLRSEITRRSTQSIRQSVNLKSLQIGSDGEPFATAIYPISKYTDANGNQQTIGIASVNDNVDYIENIEAVNRFGRIVRFVQYEGISSPLELKRIATADLVAKHLSRPTVYEVEAVDMTNINLASPLEVDTLVPIISIEPQVNTVEPLNVMDVDLVNPQNLQLKFNDGVRSLAGYRR